MNRLDPSARVRNHVTEVLDGGSIQIDDLTAVLAERGLELGPDPYERVCSVMDEMDEIGWLTVENPDAPNELLDIVYNRGALIDGTTWTVPIGDVDLASDTLSSDALGLAFVAMVNRWAVPEGVDSVSLDLDGRRQAAAGDLDTDTGAGAGVLLPEGWLSNLGARPGGYVELHFDGEVIRAKATDNAPEPTDEMLEALVEAMSSGIDQGGSLSLADVLIQVLVTHDELRSAVLPPVDVWLGAAGLIRRGPMIAPAGFDFEHESLIEQIEDAIKGHGLKGRDAISFTKLAEAWYRWRSAASGSGSSGTGITDNPRGTGDWPDDAMLSVAASSLDSILVAQAFADMALDERHADELSAFGERLTGFASGRYRAGPAWLVAQAFGSAGALERFETWIDAALDFDDEHLLSLFDKAWFEFDRGEYRKAKSLMNRVGLGPDDHDMMLIDSVLQPTGLVVGRNDPCPCGSGRKYKRCHLGVDEIPLSARLTLLYRKANRWLEHRHMNEVYMMAMVRAGNSGASPDHLLETDPLIPDTVLSEGGRFDDWLAERGALLPSDEAMLALQWSLIERSVYEVTEVRHDQGLTLRDVRTGDVVDVTERLGTHGMKTGLYLLARPLPTGEDTLQFFGGITFVPDSMLQAFIDLLDSEPEAFQLLALVAKAESPPQLRNTDQDPLVFSDMTWRIDDEVDAIRALDNAFERDDSSAADTADAPDTANSSDDSTSRWIWLAEPDERAGDTDGSEPDDGRTVLANLTLVNGRLHIDTNSMERAERVIAMIADALPDAELLERLESTLEDIREDEAYERYVFEDPDGKDSDENDSDAAAPGMIDPANMSPELRAALRKQTDLHEERWVDESIPALGGATPREALDDPTRRDDLFRLLARMEDMEARIPLDQAGLGMRTSRLRELLGL